MQPQASSTCGCRRLGWRDCWTRRWPRARRSGGSGRMNRDTSTWSSCRPTLLALSLSATRAAPSSAICSAASWRAAATGSRASTTSTIRGARCASWEHRWRRTAWGSRCRRSPTAVPTWRSWRSRCPSTRGPLPRPPASIAMPPSGTGRVATSARASRPAWSASACTSMSGRVRPACTRRAGWIAPSPGCATAATCTNPRAPRGSAPRRSVMTRTVSSTGPVVSPPTSHRTSAMSARSSAADSTSSSTSGAPTTTERWPACATRRRPWASTGTQWRCSWSPGCASCVTAWRSP